MTVHIDFAPRAEAWIKVEARRRGVLPEEVVRSIVDERVVELEDSDHVELTAVQQNAAAIALLNRWIEEDATDDPAEIQKAEEDVEDLKRNLNANRAATGERLVFL